MMKQKRFRKLMMAHGLDRNKANTIIRSAAELRWKMQSSKYQEIYKLSLMLEEAMINYICVPHIDGFHILCMDENDEQICSIIEHRFSYGHEGDKLEIMGLLTEQEQKYDDVRGWMTAKEVVERIRQYFKENHHE